MYDSAMAVQEVYQILIQDSTISDKVKEQLSRRYPCSSTSDEALFLASALCFGMERTFVKRNSDTKKLLSAGNLSPVIKDFVFDGDVPKVCPHFCGRETELCTLHDLIENNKKVFLQGIAGIGKSEVAKAYAQTYRKEYTNILYLTYSGDLRQDIINLDFADDLPEDSEEDRFRKHNRFLRTLKDDTLLIIDNFNTTATKDSFLSVVLKYRCRIIFTTRSRFDNYTSMDLEEISDPEALLSLMGCFYSDAGKYSSVLKQIIQLFDARVDERDTVRDQIYQKLYATMGQRFDASLFHESVSDIDHLLGEDLETFREQAYQKRALWKMERRKKQPVQLKKKVHDHER